MNTTIQAPPRGTVPASSAPESGRSASAATATATPAGVAEPLPTQVSSEQLAMQVLLDDASGGSTVAADTTEEAEPTANSNGAPWLATPAGASMSAAGISVANFLRTSAASCAYERLRQASSSACLRLQKKAA